MNRRKSILEWIGSKTARKSSFKKRKGGLLKKVSELSTLCGVSACVIVFGQDNDERAVWPPARPVVEELLKRFESVPESKRSKKMMNQETYLEEKQCKMQEQLRKTHKKNKEMEMTNIMVQIQKGKPLHDYEFGTEELTRSIWFLKERMKEIQKRIEYFEKYPNIYPLGVFSPPPPPPPPPHKEGESKLGHFNKEKGKLNEEDIASGDDGWIAMQCN